MKRTAALLSLSLGLLSGISAVSAATFDWTGSGSAGNLNLWLVSQNWQQAGVPGAADIANFSDVAVTRSITPTINAGQTAPIAGIIFNAAADPYNISGAGTLNIGASGIVNSSGTAQTFSVANVGLTASATFINNTVSSSLNFTGSTLDLAGNTLTVDGPGTTTIGNVISGTGGLVKNGAGILNLNAAETYTGNTTINAGQLSFGAAQSLSGGVVLTGGALVQNNTGASTFGALTVNGAAAIDLAASGSLTFASATYTSGLLTVNNWEGPPFNPDVLNTGATGSAIFITAEPDASFLANVQFVGSVNTYPQGSAWLSGTGELVPAPEPQVYAAVFAIGLLGFAIARRRMIASA